MCKLEEEVENLRLERLSWAEREVMLQRSLCALADLQEEVEKLKAAGLTVQNDGLPDPTNVDSELNYHLQVLCVCMCHACRSFPCTSSHLRWVATPSWTAGCKEGTGEAVQEAAKQRRL